jgi:hypothetical protein
MDPMMQPGPPAGTAPPPPSAGALPPPGPPPVSEKGYKASDIKALAKQANATLEALLGPAYDAMPPEQREVKVDVQGPRVEAFPPQLWAAVSVIDQAVKTFAPDAAEKYDLELAALGDPSQVSVTAGKLRMIEKDKKLLKRLQEPDPSMVPGAPPAPKPEEMAAMDERAMGAM